jgi:hypothetical protein
MGVLLLLARRYVFAYGFLGNSLPLVVPLLAVASFFVLLNPRTIADTARRQRVFLLCAVAACCALIQFPFAVSIYFCYAAPLAILAVGALISLRPRFDRFALGSLLAFYLVFAVWLGTPGYLLIAGARRDRGTQLTRLRLSRAGGLLVRPAEAAEYERLIQLIREHARGPYIYCTPDCPQVYFLSGKRNPTGTFWDFLEPDFLDVGSRTARILATVANYGVSVVVLRDKPLQSGPVPLGLRLALAEQFPEARRVGIFEVRWRPRAKPSSGRAQ